MQLNGIGGSAATFSNNSGTATQVGSIGERHIIEDKAISGQARKVSEKRPIEEKRYTPDEVVENVEKANKMLSTYDRRFEISIHEKTKQVMVKVIDSTTDEVIREIPSEKVLDMVAGFMEVAGIIVDKRI